MRLLRRPWAREEDPADPVTPPLGPRDCLLVEGSEVPPTDPRANEHTRLLRWQQAGAPHALCLHPYPRHGHAETPLRIEGLPGRPRTGAEPRDDAEREALAALERMTRVLARITELEAALDDPANVWLRLAEAWQAACSDEQPRMAEIVRQAGSMPPRLRDLEGRLRRVLRREREQTPLDRVQEMDRASMVWLSRQPGTTVAERAGAGQRVLATVRRENHDTLENRVVHAHAALAARVAREWVREHPGARTSERWQRVDAFRRFSTGLARRLRELGIGRAEAGIVPNYVLMQDPDYRAVHAAWTRLLEQERVLDDLWSWQAECWTDFCTLAVVLALRQLEDARLVAQSPIVWRAEADRGRFFRPVNPLAVFWLGGSDTVVEVQARPGGVSSRQAATRAAVFLRISRIDGIEGVRRVAVWTPHSFARHDLGADAEGAARRLQLARNVPSTDRIDDGLVLAQAFGKPEAVERRAGPCRVRGIALDAAGGPLEAGMERIRAFVRDLFAGGWA